MIEPAGCDLRYPNQFIEGRNSASLSHKLSIGEWLTRGHDSSGGASISQASRKYPHAGRTTHRRAAAAVQKYRWSVSRTRPTPKKVSHAHVAEVHRRSFARG